jgi:hypothetical protein
MHKRHDVYEPERGDKPAEMRDKDDDEGASQIASALIL